MHTPYRLRYKITGVRYIVAIAHDVPLINRYLITTPSTSHAHDNRDALITQTKNTHDNGEYV